MCILEPVQIKKIFRSALLSYRSVTDLSTITPNTHEAEPTTCVHGSQDRRMLIFFVFYFRRKYLKSKIEGRERQRSSAMGKEYAVCTRKMGGGSGCGVISPLFLLLQRPEGSDSEDANIHSYIAIQLAANLLDKEIHRIYSRHEMAGPALGHVISLQ